jgi:hypothetical protein
LQSAPAPTGLGGRSDGVVSKRNDAWGIDQLGLKGRVYGSFSVLMKVSPSLAGAEYTVAVAKKQQDQVKEQGQQALKLIEAATPASPPKGTGQLVNVVA